MPNICRVMMQILVLLCFSGVIAIITAEVWRKKSQISKWEMHLVRRTVRTEIAKFTLKSGSLTECSHVCSEQMGVQALSLYFVPETSMCYCNLDIDNGPEDASVAQIYYGTLKQLHKKEETQEKILRHTVWPYLPNCLGLYEANHRDDAVYVIDPTGGAPTDTWCDMTNGGWTVIQRRMDGSEAFYRGWTDYVSGFGNKTGEYWLGLENIHHLTTAGSQLEVFLETFPGITPPNVTAYYTSFAVGDYTTNYTLTVSGFTGDCGDSLSIHDGQPFTTFDNDNDENMNNCAVIHLGAWWYKVCHLSNLNGHYYQSDETVRYGDGINWWTCLGYKNSMRYSVMKVNTNSP